MCCGYFDPYIEILCSAETCVHYKDFKCIAPKISIVGAGAQNDEKTQCNTFVEKN